MSNYIFNDGFGHHNDDKEPVQITFGENQSTGNKNLIVWVCVISIVISALVGALGGVFFGKQIALSSAPNTVYTNTLYQSPLTNPSTADGKEMSRADIIEDIKPTVVEIKTEYRVSKYKYGGTGSGVIVGSFHNEQYNPETSEPKNPDGYYIITNAHVVEGASSDKVAEKITVILTDGTSYDASVCGYDVRSDLSVLKISENKKVLQCATFVNDNYNLRVGDAVIAIGNPLGELGGTVTNGYVSALDREIEIDGIKMSLLQTDAAINQGNSGGGLFNLNGELIGVVNAKSFGTGIEGLGFAIPAYDALKVFKDLTELGYVSGRPTIMADFMNLGQDEVYITEVYTSSNGDNSNVLNEYDQICEVVIDGVNYIIKSASTLENLICDSKIGDELTLVIKRSFSNKRTTVTVKVFEFTK